MTFSVKKFPGQFCVIPTILPRQTLRVLPQEKTQLSTQFNLCKPKFAALAQMEALSKLKSHCIEIDISEELAVLKKGFSLEVTLPILGLIDLLKTTTSQEKRLYPTPLTINGFGAKQSIENNYPHPEFVLVTDIMGNQFEIVVNADGSIEIPDDGTGLFSLLSSITFMYSENQISEGGGLEDFREFGLSKKLLLLPPEDSIEPFEVIICVSHINERHQRIVDTIRPISVQYPALGKDDYRVTTSIELDSDVKDKLNINLTLSQRIPFSKYYPFTACVTLKGEGKTVFFENQGWLQDPLRENVYTKHIGLSNGALNLLVRKLYSEYDFIKDYLKGDTFNLSIYHGYNNFLLMPQALICFYERFVNDVVHHRISGDYFLARVPQEKLMTLNLSYISADFHDSIVLSRLQSEIEENQFDNLKGLFYSKDSSDLHECFSVFAPKFTGPMPTVLFDILPANPFLDEQNQQNKSSFNKPSEEKAAASQEASFDLNTILELQASLPWRMNAQEAPEVDAQSPPQTSHISDTEGKRDPTRPHHPD